MATPEKHAICSASASERWLNCTAAPRYEEQFPESTSPYAEEGRLAHSVCELMGRLKFSEISTEEYDYLLEAIKANPKYDPEMLKTAEFYVGYIMEKTMLYPEHPAVTFELQVDFSEYVPDGFGTCDNIIIGSDTLRITDYKHGKGVKVETENNSQMRLYALGALKFFEMAYSDIKYVTMAIVQPRITEDVTEETLTVEELKAWGESIKPKAQAAYTGKGAEFVVGDWCRFCKGYAVCKARAEHYSAFNDFKGCVNTLSNDEIAKLLTDAAGLVEWYDSLKEYAQQEILNGRIVPGWKVVAGKSNRAFKDEEEVKKVLVSKLKLKTADIYKPREMKTLTGIEKMLGKNVFAEYLGGLVVKPVGKPTLVPEDDSRPPYSSAAADFAGVDTVG